MVIEIVSLPINSMVIFHSYVSLPEGMLFWYILGMVEQSFSTVGSGFGSGFGSGNIWKNQG